MGNKDYILAIDQGTTGTKVVVFDHSGSIVGEANREIKQYYPNPGWVEYDPMEYWNTTMSSIDEVFRDSRLTAQQISSIGITCQRETTILWDRDTGEPVHNAIVWQCRRTAEICDRLKAQGHEEIIRQKTALLIDAYFSATKIIWLMENVPGVREKMDRGRHLAYLEDVRRRLARLGLLQRITDASPQYPHEAVG
jgi:glycerol kinase